MAAYGTLGIVDLLNTTTQSIIQAGPDYERLIWEVFESSLDAHNRIMNDLMESWIEMTTDRLIGYGGIQQMSMDDIDEWGTPHAQKVTPGTNMGFPLRLRGITHQWTRTAFEDMTPADVAGQLMASMDADRMSVIATIKRAIYSSTNYSWVDIRKKDRATIPVKALCNADSMPVPVGPNGETFNAATHTHYAGTSSFANTDLDALITNVAEHYANNAITLYINATEESTVRGFTGFQPMVDVRVHQPTTSTYVDPAAEALNLYQYNNRDIGYYKGATIAVRPWCVSSYVVAHNALAPKVLAFREKVKGSGGFRLVYEDESYPLRSKGFFREFGIAPKNRWGAAVLYISNATYSAPTITG